MSIVNMLQAKSNLSRLVEEIEQGKESEIIIARNGRPAAKLVAIDVAAHHQRIGIAKGAFEVPENIDAHNNKIAEYFEEKILEFVALYS